MGMTPSRMPLAIAATALIALAEPALSAGAWSWSALPGEERRSQLVCSPAGDDHAWLCLALRCEQGDGIALYAELTNLALDTRFDLVFADRRITVWGRTHDPALPYSHRIDGPIDEILAALRANPSVTIDRPAAPLNPEMATIPISGADEAIGAIEGTCAGDAGAAPAAAWELHDARGWCSLSRPGDADAATRATFATPHGSELVYLRLTYPARSFTDDADVLLSADLSGGGVTTFTAKATGDAIADLDHAVPPETLSQFLAATAVTITATPPGAAISVRMDGLGEALAELAHCAGAPAKN